MLLNTTGLAKQYGRRMVVTDVSMIIERGEVVGLLGRNGAGKTTTFKMIVGLVRPQRGTILLDGQEITRDPIYKRARKGMGYLSQEPSIFQRLSVEDNLLALLETIEPNRKLRRKICLELLEEYGLFKLAKQKAHTLSGGETRRLEICRTMITSPSLILLDEPFSGVDPIAVHELQGFIKRLREKGIGVLLTDHNVRETLAITDRSYIIDDGIILASGTRDEVLQNSMVRQKYLGEHFQM